MIPDTWELVSSRLWRNLKAGTLPRDLLIVGPAGTGKTYSILAFLHVLARDNRNLRIVLSRATRSALTESVLVTYEQEILPLDGMEWLAAGVKRRVRQAYTYPNGTEVVCGSLDDPTRILSTAWDFAFVNEATEGTEDAWQALLSRMNRPGRSRRFGFLIGDTNPGPPDHWLKRRGDAGRTVHWDTAHQANPAMHDGRDWTPAGRDYLDTLNQLTGTQRSRLLLGLWSVGEGLWFDRFDPAVHVRADADHDPAVPAFLGVDPGPTTGATLFQIRHLADGRPYVNAFADYLHDARTAEQHALALRALIAERCGSVAAAYCDPSGGARTAIGPTVMDEYRRAGLPLRPWAPTNPPVLDSLANVEVLVAPAEGPPRLAVHPRCKALINAFLSYRRAKVANQWQDHPADPQHPSEDLIDSLRGGLYARMGARKTLRITSR